MKIQSVITTHLVKGEDLNHHGTLYAGRGAEWMVEAGFIAASMLTNTENIVCLRINSLLFRKPIQQGQLVKCESRIVFAGRTSLIAYVKVSNARNEEFIVDGFFTFVHVNIDGRPMPHGIRVEPNNPEEANIQEQAHQLVIEAKQQMAEKKNQKS
jgi:acyl-CoA hydrolase